MKKRLLIVKIIGFIGILLFVIGISYVFTFYLEKEKFNNINLEITFEDTKEFSLENTKLLTYEETLQTYPYIFEVLNKGKSLVNYQIKIKDEETNITRNDLEYILFLNDKEVKKGNLSELDSDILYENKIKNKKKDTYKLYVYLNKEIDEVIYKYSLEMISCR